MANKEAAEILSIDGREVRISNPDKPYFSRGVKLVDLDARPRQPAQRSRENQAVTGDTRPGR